MWVEYLRSQLAEGGSIKILEAKKNEILDFWPERKWKARLIPDYYVTQAPIVHGYFSSYLQGLAKTTNVKCVYADAELDNTGRTLIHFIQSVSNYGTERHLNMDDKPQIADPNSVRWFYFLQF